MIDVRPDSLAFRHELTRRAIERSLPALRRRSLNAAVVAALRAQPRPEPARVMHHAVEASDVETILAVGPSAAREAERAGSHRQALAHYESMRPHLHRVPARERADLLDGYGWELYNAHRFRDAVAAGREAAGLYEQLEDPVALGECLVRTSRHLFMAGETDEAERCALRALAILEPAGDEAALAHASLYTGAILALTDDPLRARRAARARARAGRALGTAGPGGARAQLPRHRAHRARRSERAGAAPQERRGGDRRAPARVRRARLLQPRRDARARRPARRARGGRGRGPALRARARLLVARVQPRGPPLRRARAPRQPRRGGVRAARARRGGGRPRDALRLQRAVARPRARAPRRSRGGRDARGGVGARPPAAAAARPRLRRARVGGVGVAGRRAGGRPARGRRAAAAHRPSRRRAVPGGAPALPRPRRPSRRAVRWLP